MNSTGRKWREFPKYFRYVTTRTDNLVLICCCVVVMATERMYLIVPIWKRKGDVHDLRHFRGITQLSQELKLLERVLEARIRRRLGGDFGKNINGSGNAYACPLPLRTDKPTEWWWVQAGLSRVRFILDGVRSRASRVNLLLREAQNTR